MIADCYKKLMSLLLRNAEIDKMADESRKLIEDKVLLVLEFNLMKCLRSWL
jgi:hypothetical protein